MMSGGREYQNQSRPPEGLEEEDETLLFSGIKHRQKPVREPVGQ